MNRRTFLRTAGVAGGTLAVAGCLDDGDDSSEPITNVGSGPPEYDPPAYSAWPPAESHTGRGVTALSMRLDATRGVQQALAAGRLPADEPLVGLPAAAVEAIPEAVATLSSYPFAAPLRRAINVAAGTDPTADDVARNETVIDPVNRSIDGVAEEPTVAGNETAAATNGTTVGNGTTVAPNGTATAGNGTSEDGNATVARNATVAGNTTVLDGNATVLANGTTPANETMPANATVPANGTTPTAVTAATDEPIVDTLGIEVERVTLIDGLLVCHGSYDTAVIADRYTAGFEEVDQQRGLSIYEATDGELAFAVSDDVLVVPTERPDRESPAETVLAHGLSGYVVTVGRMVDDEDGRWLFESTGEAPLAVAVWGADDPLGAVTSAAPKEPAIDGEGLLVSADGLVSALDVTTDEERVTGGNGRFAGLFSTAAPTEDELRASLVGGGSDSEIYLDAERVHVMATFGDD